MQVQLLVLCKFQTSLTHVCTYEYDLIISLTHLSNIEVHLICKIRRNQTERGLTIFKFQYLLVLNERIYIYIHCLVLMRNSFNC